jgi:hypothetical protein
MRMKTSITGLLGEAARKLSRYDPSRAYALYELANNLRLVVIGEASLDDFRDVYVVEPGSKPFDIDALLP